MLFYSNFDFEVKSTIRALYNIIEVLCFYLVSNAVLKHNFKTNFGA